MEEYSEIEQFELQLNESAKGFLKESAKWAYFLSILGYIGIGFILLMAIFAGALFAYISNLTRQMSNVGAFDGSFISVLYFLIAVLYFFPIYYLNRFASNAKVALRNNDSKSLANSFEYLKSHYKFFGIIAVIMLCFYVLVIVFALIALLAVSLK